MSSIEDEDKAQADAHMQETIVMFEQILEVMPDDEMALRTLYDAYMHTDALERAYAMLQRLTRVVLDAHADDHDMLEFLIGQFDLHAERVNGEAEELLAELKRRFEPGGEEATRLHVPSGVPVLAEANVGDEDRTEAELALAWRLFQEQIITREDYDQVVQDLTVMAARQAETPTTVLYALHDRSYTHFSSVLMYMARESGSPFISLTCFDLSEDLFTLLPWEFVTRHAAFFFKMIGNEMLAAVLNPFDEKLRQTLSRMTGRVCHTYLITPEEYDFVLNKFRDIRTKS